VVGQGGQINEQSGRTSGQKRDISESQKQVLNLIVNNPSISRGEISHILGINESAISKHIDKLKQMEYLNMPTGQEVIEK
jgi:DNA-binding MarR family transcriptional regulator